MIDFNNPFYRIDWLIHSLLNLLDGFCAGEDVSILIHVQSIDWRFWVWGHFSVFVKVKGIANIGVSNSILGAGLTTVQRLICPVEFGALEFHQQS